MKELKALDGGKNKKTLPAMKLDRRPLITFGLAIVLYAIVALICRKPPFGTYSFLVSDLSGQYAPFLILLRNKLIEIFNSSPKDFVRLISYSFCLGLGKNFLGSYGYYLASPFNVLTLLFKPSQIDMLAVVIVSLKLTLSASFMCLFLGSRSDDKKSKWPVLLGLVYAFSLYSQAFMFHIMWLDGYLLLPLLLYFVEKYIRTGKYKGVIFTLLVLFWSNYYIAYMVGAFSFVYLLIRLYTVREDLKAACRKVIKFIALAVMSAMSVAGLIIPVGLDTLKNADQTIHSSAHELVLYTPLDLMDMLLLGDPGEFGDVMPSNKPFIFLSLLVTMLLFIYLVSPLFKGREKKIYIACLAGVYISTAIYWFDKIWQVCDDPNWFWHRHAFVFLPFFLVIAQKVLEKIREIRPKDMTISAGIMLVMLFIVHTIGRFKGEDKIFMYNIILILVNLSVLLLYTRKSWPKQLEDMPQMISPLLAALTVFELVFAGPMLTAGIETFTNFNGDTTEFAASVEELQSFSKIAEENNAIVNAYRTDAEEIENYNLEYYVDSGFSMYGNFRGLQFFNSNSNKLMHRFLKQLGYATNYNYFVTYYTFANPASDAFFSIGTVACRKSYGMGVNMGSVTPGGHLEAYSNPYVLPLGFASDRRAMDFDFYRLEEATESKDYFALQNDWYNSLFPDAFTEDFFISADGAVGEPELTGGFIFDKNDYMTGLEYEASQKEDPEAVSVAVSDPLGREAISGAAAGEEATVINQSNKNVPIVYEYNFTSESDKELYLNISCPRVMGQTSVYVNNILIASGSEDTYYSRIYRLGSFAEGEEVKITIMSNSSTWKYQDINFAYFDEEIFDRQLASVDTSKVKVSAFEDGLVKFDINGLKSNETVITTIPAEDGWTLYIDGEPCEYNVYQQAFISFDCPSGSHTAELRYKAPGLKAGLMVTVLGIVSLITFAFVDKKNSKLKDTAK